MSYFLLQTSIQISTIINASHIVAEIFHDDGMHTCEFKTLNFSNPTDPAWVASMLRMTYDSLKSVIIEKYYLPDQF